MALNLSFSRSLSRETIREPRRDVSSQVKPGTPVGGD
jgi:hypothetical protein